MLLDIFNKATVIHSTSLSTEFRAQRSEVDKST